MTDDLLLRTLSLPTERRSKRSLTATRATPRGTPGDLPPRRCSSYCQPFR